MKFRLNNLRVDGVGEGSRGGHVVGHTSSGKTIYALHNHPSHAGFTAMDHYEAGRKHDEEAKKLFDENERINTLANHKTKKKSAETLKKIKFNREVQNAHEHQAQKHFGSWVEKGGLKVTHPEET